MNPIEISTNPSINYHKKLKINLFLTNPHDFIIIKAGKKIENLPFPTNPHDFIIIKVGEKN